MSTPSTFVVSEDEETLEVDAIDIWFSARRGVWIVERVTADGRTLGAVFLAQAEGEALECRDVWGRGHPDAHLPPPCQIVSKMPGREGRRAA